MKLGPTNIRVSTTDEEALKGLLLSFLTAAMKSNKANKSNAIDHFMRERLSQKKDRRLLNVGLNAIASSLAKGSKVKIESSKQHNLKSISGVSDEMMFKSVLEDREEILEWIAQLELTGPVPGRSKKIAGLRMMLHELSLIRGTLRMHRDGKV